jgi:tryptophan synthase beta subunit
LADLEAELFVFPCSRHDDRCDSISQALCYAERLMDHYRAKAATSGASCGAKLYFKREELNHTGAHKINNALGHILLARRMGVKKRQGHS